ncbi:MAG: hypothetical protein M0010_19135 [Actinomycetota bacterium]|nr:hypothetical protein [Actinomycetota bacterium]
MRAAHRRRSSALWAFRSDGLVAIALALYFATIRTIPASRIGQYGLVPALPKAVLVAAGLLVIAVAVALGAAKPVSARLWAYLFVLLFFLYGTPAVVYREGRYSWLYKTVGVIQYVNAHGALNRSIDIYQNWPGFFALTAWFDKIAGIGTPLVYAKWAQLGFEVLIVVVLAFALRALPLSEKERWTALFLYAATNWIAQDYLSPQAVGVVLSLGVLAIALHWLIDPSATNRLGQFFGRIGEHLRLGPRHENRSRVDAEATVAVAPVRNLQTIVALVGLFLVYFVLVFTHELSPYLVVAQLGGLALIGKFRPGWAAAGMLAIAIAYLAPRFTFVNQKYGLLSSVGSFFGNAAPPSSYLGTLSAGAHLDQLGADALSLGMWALGALGLYLRWRRGRPVLVMAALAALPGLAIFAEAYGGEAILRVYLFSLPWTAALGASAVWELASLVPWRRAVQIGVLLAGCLCLFSAAFYGDDEIYVMPTREVQAMQTFYRTAAPGPVYELNANVPGLLSSRYNLFPQYALTGQYGVMGSEDIGPDSGSAVAHALHHIHATYGHPAYIVLAPSVRLYAKDTGSNPPHDYENLWHSLLSDHQWIRVVDRSGVLIEELPTSVVLAHG